MYNALKYGSFIGFLAAAWILFMQLLGYYQLNPEGPKTITWMEYLSVWIPFAGLYLGIKNHRNTRMGRKMSFLEGIVEGFKILLISGLIHACTLSLFLSLVFSSGLETEYMQRLVAAGLVGILLVLVVSLMLMNYPKNL